MVTNEELFEIMLELHRCNKKQQELTGYPAVSCDHILEQFEKDKYFRYSKDQIQFALKQLVELNVCSESVKTIFVTSEYKTEWIKYSLFKEIFNI